jgi:hypothetical protein
MTRPVKHSLKAAVFVAANLSLGVGGTAVASPLVLSIDINGTTDTFTDSGTPNEINVDFTIGSVTVSGEFALQTIGVDTLASSALSVINGGSGTATITAALSGQNFTGPAAIYGASGSGTWLNSPGSVMSQSWYYDPSNALGGSSATDLPGILLVSHTYDPAGSGTSSFAFTGAGSLPVIEASGALFSMSEGWSYSIDAGGELTSRGQDEIASVPEPDSLLLLGAGVGCLALMGRGRRHWGGPGLGAVSV